MKNKFRIFLTGSILMIAIFSINSCRKDFSLDEFDKLNNDSLQFEGSVAIPIVNTELTLINFVPASDSSLWAEVDENDLVHIRMFYRDLITLRMSDIFPGVNYSGNNSGDNVLANFMEIQSDTSKMKVYNNMLSGKLFFADPSITFHLHNEIPVVTFFKMDTLIFHDFESQAISHTDHTKYTIPAPTITGTQEDTTIIIDKVAIPALADVFSPVPRFISFFVSAGSDSDQNLPFNVTGDEELKVDVDIDLPLDARLDTIVMADTIPFAWDGDTYEQIKSATLKIRMSNGFPIDGFSQIYFADTTDTGEIGNIVDSVFTDIDHPDITTDGWHLKPASTDADGEVINTSIEESEIIIVLDQERVNLLQSSHASKMIITGKLNSYNSHTGLFIKILGAYKMGVQIAVKADFETTATGQ